MEKQKAAVKSFLDTTRKIMVYHFTKALNTGEITKQEYDESLENFNDRSAMIMNVFNKQTGGAPLTLPTSLPKPSLNSLSQIDPEEIQAEVDKLMAFQPKDALPESIKPTIDNSLWIFVPEVRETVKQVLGAFFLVGSLDKLPIFGPLIATAMDVALAYLPALAATIQNIVPNIVALAPIPYANFAGEAAGYAISAVLMFITIMTQASRGEFMGVLEGVAGLVPVFGTTLMTYVNKVNNVYQKIEARRQQIMASLLKLQAFMIVLFPQVSVKAQQLILRFLPIFNTLFKASATSVIQVANVVLDNVKPVINAARKRLQQTGGRYKRTIRRKQKHKKNKQRTRSSRSAK